MRLVTFASEGGSDIGIWVDGGVIAIGKRLGVPSLRALIAGEKMADAQTLASEPISHRAEEVVLLPPLEDPKHFFCVGTNYLDHLHEVQQAGIDRPMPKGPALFVRFPETLVAHEQSIVIPHVSDSLDYEGELAVVIGKGGRYIAEVNALAHVAGYSCFNDGSVRDWQFHTSQVTSGKNFISTGGFGPWLVTADEIADPQTLAISTRLNGNLLQQGNTRDMIFSVAAVIAYASALLPLEPGDVIATGTPSGVGFSRKPPIFMKHGDVCEIMIEGIGTLRNPIAKASD